MKSPIQELRERVRAIRDARAEMIRLSELHPGDTAFHRKVDVLTAMHNELRAELRSLYAQRGLSSKTPLAAPADVKWALIADAFTRSPKLAKTLATPGAKFNAAVELLKLGQYPLDYLHVAHAVASAWEDHNKPIPRTLHAARLHPSLRDLVTRHYPATEAGWAAFLHTQAQRPLVLPDIMKEE